MSDPDAARCSLFDRWENLADTQKLAFVARARAVPTGARGATPPVLGAGGPLDGPLCLLAPLPAPKLLWRVVLLARVRRRVAAGARGARVRRAGARGARGARRRGRALLLRLPRPLDGRRPRGALLGAAARRTVPRVPAHDALLLPV